MDRTKIERFQKEVKKNGFITGPPPPPAKKKIRKSRLNSGSGKGVLIQPRPSLSLTFVLQHKLHEMESEVESLKHCSNNANRRLNRGSFFKKNEQDEAISDNPCWGGALACEHDLHFLLNRIHSSELRQTEESLSTSNSIGKQDIIIFESDDYIVINKPPDLRMDGPHLATVHKLLTYWNPTPYILEKLEKVKSPSIIRNAAQKFEDYSNCNKDLIGIVQTLAKHNSIPDNILRPCHQLDYATSGVLLVAKNKKAAGCASQAFENRTTKKTYLTVVHGHVDISKVPYADASTELLQTWIKGMGEENYRRKKKNIHKQTFLGFMPVHAIFGKWKAYQLKIKNEKYHLSLKKIEEDDQLDREKSQSSINENDLLNTCNDFTVLEVEELLQKKWSEIKRNKKYHKIFSVMAQQYNESTKQKQEEEQNRKKRKQNHIQNLPHVFRIQEDDPNVFYVHASIAQPNNSGFRMMLEPSAIPSEYSSHFSLGTNNTLHNDGLSEEINKLDKYDYKPAFTKCSLLSTGFYCHPSCSLEKSILISKLVLNPLTGRRHQLRLHMIACGHSILGDVTYELSHHRKGDYLCPRMCLHAWKLTIPLQRKALEGEHERTKVATFRAIDPFQMCRAKETKVAQPMLQLGDLFI